MKRIIAIALAAVLLSGLLCAAAEDAAGSLQPGDTVFFGHYRQDSGTGAIEWTVLETRGEKALLISRFLLDTKRYHEKENENTTWETSSIRHWLNSEFLNRAFSRAEQEAVLVTEVDNGQAQGYEGYSDVPGGMDTRDRLFLLSRREAFELYFSGEEDRTCLPTDYAVSRGIYAFEDGEPTWWWLRSPGGRRSYALCVGEDGTMASAEAAHAGGGVRPAMWVDTASAVFLKEQDGEPKAQRSLPEGKELAGTWIGFDVCMREQSYADGDFVLLRFDPEEEQVDTIENNGFDLYCHSWKYRTEGETLFRRYEDGYEEAYRFGFVDGKLLTDLFGMRAYRRLEEGMFPEEPENNPFLGENKTWAADPLEDGTLRLYGMNMEEEDSLQVPSDLFGIPVTVLMGLDVKRAILPRGILRIGAGEPVFSSSTESVELPDTLLSIGDRAFEYCESLREIHIPEGTRTLGMEAFFGCEGLTAVTLPASLTEIGEDAFYGVDPEKTAFTVPEGSYAEEWCLENGMWCVSMDPEGNVGKETRPGFSVAGYLDEGMLSVQGLLYAGEQALEAGADPKDVVKEMRALAADSGALEALDTACANLAGADTPEGRKLRKMGEEEFRRLSAFESGVWEAEEAWGMTVYDVPEVSDGMKEALKDPDARYCAEPFLWTEKDFKSLYATEFDRFIPASPRPGYVCVVLRDSAQCGVGTAWDRGDEKTDDFLYYLDSVIDVFRLGVMTGNPHLASLFLVIEVSYPFHGLYGERGEVKGYDCRLKVTAVNARDHSAAAEFTQLSALEDTIYDWTDGIAQADYPWIDPWTGEEALEAFRNKALQAAGKK